MDNIKYSKIMYKIIVASLLLFSILCQNNYQQRSIFYSRSDNLCCDRQHRDQFNLIINLDDTNQFRRVVYGGSYCADWSWLCADAVQANVMAQLLEGSSKDIQTRIIFDQEIVSKKSFGLINHITLKLVIQNPVKILGKEYTCNILGDGTEHHWGIDYDKFNPAEVYMRCLSSKTSHNNLQNEIISQ